MLTNHVRFVTDFEKISAFAFNGDLPQVPCEQNVPSASIPSDSDPEVQNDSNAETEPDSGNDQEMIELAQKQPSKFQEALTLEVRMITLYGPGL